MSPSSASPFGHFSEDGTEFVVTNPATPRPWHNYLCNRNYLVNITQFGTGASFYQPSGEGYRANVTEDRDGNGGPRFVYLRDADTGEYWSLTGAPDFPPFDAWSCTVGLGYQINQSRYQGIEASWRVFVPQTEHTAELWTLTVTNTSERTRRISLFPFLEMHLTGGNTLMDFIAVLAGHYDPESKAVFGINNCVKFPPYFKAFLASDTQVDGMTVGLADFHGPYRDAHRPRAVERGDVRAEIAGTEWLGASLRHDLTLAPGESVRVHLTVGTCFTKEEGKATIRDLLAPGRVDALFSALQEENRARVARLRVQTPNPQFNRWVNIWLKHQLHFVGRWGRVIGRGYRDVLQDTFGLTLTNPAMARDGILEVFSKQYPSGRCIRAWRLPNAELDTQHYADSPCWMIMALHFYLRETGDFSILDAQVPFLPDPATPGVDPGSASVWDHALLAQHHLLDDRGQLGLVRIRYGDWCDTMNGVGKRGEGVSVMLSMQVKWGCDLFRELSEHLGRREVAAEMASASASLAAAIQQHCWDGAWFVRAFDDDGIAVGSARTCHLDDGEGAMFLNPQSWAIIGGIATPEQAECAVREAQSRLDTGYGMTLHGPPFSKLRPRIGQMTAMTPGYYENGSVYTHGNGFWVYALARSGRVDQALAAWLALLPDTRNKPGANTEPFVIPNYYIGPLDERRKQQNLYLSGWRTGSAAWWTLSALDGILGLRPGYDGLHLVPQLPSGWDRFSVERPFRGTTYRIEVVRGDRDGVDVEGHPHPGGPLPLCGGEVDVRVTVASGSHQ